MWFDARAALARIEVGAYPASEALDRLNSRNSQNSQPPAAHSGIPPAPAQFAEHASFATSRPPKPVFGVSTGNPMPLTQAARTRAAALPAKPPTCAACGAADWQVSLTDTKRRTLHVACWRAGSDKSAFEK